jgi:hypothetical protein
MPQQLPQDTKELLERMDRLVELMEQDGHAHWNSCVREAATLLRGGDRSGFERFLSGFGTSGSFNECVVGKGKWIDGKFAWEAGQQAIHEEFERLKSEAYTHAWQLQCNTEPSIFDSFVSFYIAAATHTKALLIVLAFSLATLVAYGLSR